MRFRTSASPARSTRLGAKLEILANTSGLGANTAAGIARCARTGTEPAIDEAARAINARVAAWRANPTQAPGLRLQAHPTPHACTQGMRILPPCRHVSELGGAEHETEPVSAAAQARIDGHEAAVKQGRQRDVLGVIGFRPAELIGDTPCLLAQSGMCARPDRGCLETGARPPRGPDIEIPAPGALVQHRAGLRPHERWRAELVGQQ